MNAIHRPYSHQRAFSNGRPTSKQTSTTQAPGAVQSGADAPVNPASRGFQRLRKLRHRAWCQPVLGLGFLLWGSLWSGASFALEFNTLQPTQSSLLFAYKQMNVPMEGRFKTFTAHLHFDSGKPAQGKAVLDAGIASLDTGSEEANDEVGDAAWFNSKKYPVAHFESTTIQPLGGNRYEVSGPLTIKGHTRLVSTPVTVTIQGTSAIFDGSFDIRRADFSVGEGTWADFGTVANEVHIKFHLVATP